MGDGKIIMENYIPFDKNELVDFLIKNISDSGIKKDFKKFCSLIETIYHDILSRKFEKIEAAYLSLDPDRNTIPIVEYSEKRKLKDKNELINQIRALLKAANYVEIQKNKFLDALSKESPWGLKLKINLDEISDFFLYYRNEYPDTRTKKVFFIFKKKYNFNVYSRVVLLLKFKEEKKGKKIKENFLPDKLYLKLFKNVPTVDIEMLFPNTRIMISTFDKLMIIIPLIGGIGVSIYQIINFFIKQGTNIHAIFQISFLGIIIGFFGFALRAFIDYQNKVEHYLRTLTSNLYFQNLDNNTGVYEYLLDNAEDEEFKEIVLGYYFLMLMKGKKINANTLDEIIEKFFISKFGKALDFEIEDSIRKLKELGLLIKNKSYIDVIPLKSAIKKLQNIVKEKI